MNFVAINFHQKALADRLEENRRGLKALDSLSKAHPVAPKKHPHHKQRGHKGMSTVASMDFATLPHQGEQQYDTVDVSTTRGHHTTLADDSGTFSSKSSTRLQPKRRTKKVTSVIVNQVRHLTFPTFNRFFCLTTFLIKVGEAIGQFALKNSKFYKQGDFTGLDSARKLARKLFSVLKLTKSHLVVEGKFYNPSNGIMLNDTSDFYPYFRSTSEAVSIVLA